MPTGVLGYPFEDEAYLGGQVVCNGLSVNGYGWICPTISDPNRICKKFRGSRRGLMVRMGDWSRMVEFKKCCRNGDSGMDCGMKRVFSGPGAAVAETLEEVERQMRGLGAETRECRAMRRAVELFLEWCGQDRVNADRDAGIARVAAGAVSGVAGTWKSMLWELGGSLVHRLGGMKTPLPRGPDDGVIMAGDRRRSADLPRRPYRKTPVMEFKFPFKLQRKTRYDKKQVKIRTNGEVLWSLREAAST